MVLASLYKPPELSLKWVGWERNGVSQGPIDTMELYVHSMGLLKLEKVTGTSGGAIGHADEVLKLEEETLTVEFFLIVWK